MGCLRTEPSRPLGTAEETGGRRETLGQGAAVQQGGPHSPPQVDCGLDKVPTVWWQALRASSEGWDSWDPKTASPVTKQHTHPARFPEGVLPF